MRISDWSSDVCSSDLCMLAPGSKAAGIYGDARQIDERHRHRYEVNIHYKDRLEAAGLRFSGMSPDGLLPEIVEIPDHPWFVGVQFHPELKSRPFDPPPLFTSFISTETRRVGKERVRTCISRCSPYH